MDRMVERYVCSRKIWDRMAVMTFYSKDVSLPSSSIFKIELSICSIRLVRLSWRILLPIGF